MPTTQSQAETPTIEQLSQLHLFKPQQKLEMQESITGLENMLKASNELQYIHGVTVDRDKVMASLGRDKQMLEAGVPQDYHAGTKNRLFRVMKALEDSITYDMPTIDEMERPVPANIEKHMAWEQQHKQDILAWRAIRRILDPGNTNANFTSIETLRTNTKPKGDPRRYFKGFDHIDWQHEQEQQLSMDVDDGEYLQFLELKVLGWTEATICKKLEWKKVHYDAAMQRFRGASVAAGEVSEEPVASGNKRGRPANTAKAEPESADAELVEEHAKPWPMEELEKRGLTTNNLQQATKIASVRLYSLCSGARSKWLDEERQKVEEYFAAWDKAHAFTGG